jgi:prolyl-tRNA editing enzyme YbaK/EbsC (Cys-tRNA(Pro) deacylase)
MHPAKRKYNEKEVMMASFCYYESMLIGNLTFSPITENLGLVADPIKHSVNNDSFGNSVYVAAIDPELADTASFCETYKVPRKLATNCIVVEAKRADKIWYGACLILADDMIDVNGKVRRHLSARKISFAPKNTALALTQMEYGGITPLGLPEKWPILIDKTVLANEYVVIGGGVRGSKILVGTKVLTALKDAEVMDIIK